MSISQKFFDSCANSNRINNKIIWCITCMILRAYWSHVFKKVKKWFFGPKIFWHVTRHHSEFCIFWFYLIKQKICNLAKNNTDEIMCHTTYRLAKWCPTPVHISVLLIKQNICGDHKHFSYGGKITPLRCNPYPCLDRFKTLHKNMQIWCPMHTHIHIVIYLTCDLLDKNENNVVSTINAPYIV